jgi:hypothetical protein
VNQMRIGAIEIAVRNPQMLFKNYFGALAAQA